MKTKSFFILLLSAQFLMAQLPHIDVSGSNGRDGRDGESYSTGNRSAGFGSGDNGRDGGDASSSTSGKSAGNISVRLQDKSLVPGLPYVATVEMTADFLTAEGVKKKQQSEFSTAQAGFIHLQARGGKGGDGGRGGDGQGGQDGEDGDDATTFSSGEDGDRGGNGGHGGNGTPGSNGGAGGKIEIQLQSEDTHLTLMVAADVSGGAGGQRGENGQGGSAGRGGDGGDSHSWTTQTYIGQRCTSTTDSNGQTSQSCQDEYQTNYHRNSGGFSGSSGSGGRDGYGSVYAGSSGAPGQFSFIVDDAGKKTKYVSPFSVRVRSYDVIDQNQDGIIEPDETITIRNIKVQNTSTMPWVATKAEFLVFLENSGWVLADPIILKVPSLKSGEMVTLNGDLKFKIKKTSDYGQEKKWTSQDQIVPRNLVTRVNRTQQGFSLVKDMTITFPLEITPLVSRHSVGAGESAKILWKIKNISKQSLGKNSQSLRSIIQNLKIKDQDTKDVKYRSESEAFSLLNQNRLIELALLEPGEEVLLEGEVQFSEESLPYTERNFQIDLGLGLLNSPSQNQKIQSQSFNFKISQLYNYNQDADWVLIVNSATQREEFMAWKKLADEFGIKLDIWDMSYYGQLMLSQTMKQNKNSFAQNYKNKTVIILNNRLPSNGVMTPQRPLDQLTQMDFINSLILGNLNVVVIGPQTRHQSVFDKLIVDQTRLSTFAEEKEFLTKVQAESAKTQFGVLGLTAIKDYKIWSEITADDLKKNATKLARKLKKMNPNERYIVSYDLNVQKLGWKRFRSLMKVQKVLSPDIGQLVTLEVDDATIHQPHFVHSAENILTVLEAMSYHQKLQIFSQFKNPNTPWSQFVADAIIRDLVSEQEMAFQKTTSRWENFKRSVRGLILGESYQQGLDEKYKCLSNLKPECKPKSTLSVKTRAGSEFLRLAAALKFYSSQVQSWWNLFTLNQSDKTTASSLLLHRRDMDRLAQSIVQNYFPTEKEQALNEIKKHEAQYMKSFSDRKQMLEYQTKSELAKDLVQKAGSGSSLSTDRVFRDENLIRQAE